MIIKKKNIIEIVIPKKFSEKQIGIFMNDFVEKYKELSPIDILYFDFTQTEWIGNQNLLLLSGLIKYLYYSEKKIKIKLLDYLTLNKRRVEQICELWYVWQLHSIFDKKENDFENYIEKFDNNTLKNLCGQYKIYFDKYKNKLNYDLYDDQFSIIPFVPLDYILDGNTMNELKPVYDLNQVINNQLQDCKCNHPFTEKTISAIISKELYDNFLDHFDKEKSFFKSNQDWAFMSIALKRKLNTDKQSLFEYNFEEEELKDTKSFFFDNKTKKYKNENLIQFSFIDFGAGVVETLGNQYKKEHHIPQHSDIREDQSINNEVLKYAFKHNSSQNPILDKHEKIINYIPRGLYDLLVIVKRYKGLLIVRSNYGKILYNFSNTNDEKNFIFFDKDKKEYFPGTYISIYIPALEGFYDKSVIRPEYQYLPSQNIPTKKHEISLLSIISEINNIDIKSRYKHLLKRLSQELEYKEGENWLTYISLEGVTDTNIIRKTIFYLIGTNEVHEHNSIIIIYPPSEEIINNINEEIGVLDKDNVIRDFSINPIPVIYLDRNKLDINLDWIGISEPEDKQKLNDLLHETHSLILKDLKDGYKAVGNINRIDNFENFKSKLPTAKKLLTCYKTTIIEEAIKEFNCIKTDIDSIYLCNGNYYQESFLQLIDVLNSRKYENVIPSILFEEIKIYIGDKSPEIENFDKDLIYIAITASSHKILKSLKDRGEIKEKNCLFLDSYLNFENEIQDKIKEGANYILVCDAIATGNLAMRLEAIITNHKANFVAIAVIVNTLDNKFEKYADFEKGFKNKLIYLYQYPIEKHKRAELTNEQRQKEIIRINPYTNIPIILSNEITNEKDSILLLNEEFLECIEKNDIEIRFKLFNNLIHPYFFRTAEILEKENLKIRQKDVSHSIIHKIFSALETKKGYEKADYIFYPKNSDIKGLNIRYLLPMALKGEEQNYFELERYSTNNGWKFPHTTEYFKKEIAEKTVLILDDGSCSGDSLYQMINELSYYNPEIINVLSIIGRVESPKREFFSKIKSIKGTEKDNIKINIYFGTHWHIPVFYPEMNPYSDEIKWLNEIDKKSNVPEKIKLNADKIKKEIRPKTDEEIQQDAEILQEINKGRRKGFDYKFFPVDKKNKEIPKKEILTVRNEIGKVICYRFYVESFEWFDKHIIKKTANCYQDMDTKTRKRIEELFMCFLYEPYLYLDLIRTIPEIQSLVEKFIEDIIFEQKINIGNLQYEWRKPDIIHLFFIAYQDDKLIEKLELPKFKQLLKFAENKVNYVLCKLLYYSSLNDKEQYKGIFAKIKTEIIVAYLSPENQDVDKNVKLFNYFIASLSGKGSFRDKLQEIHEEYKRISDIKFHKENVNTYIESSRNCLNAIRKDRNNPATYKILLRCLDEVISLISKILEISESRYKSYFSEHLSLFEGDSKYSLRKIQGRLSNYSTMIFDTRTLKDDDVENLNSDIINLQDRFFDPDSTSYKIFYKITIENIKEKIVNYKNEINKTTHKYNFDIYNSSFSVYFSDYIFEDIVLKNIFGNFEKYADENEDIKIEIKDKEVKFIEITITNKSNEKYATGGLQGTHLITKLNECPNNLFRYSTRKEKEIFKQVITLRKT